MTIQKQQPRFVTPEELMEIKRNRTFEERYAILMKLRRIHKMLKAAEIKQADK